MPSLYGGTKYLMKSEQEPNTQASAMEQDKGNERSLQEGERLARFLAHAGVASRRHAEGLIAAGRVRVNDEIVTTQGVRIDPTLDRVTVDGRPVRTATVHVYILLHKPVGYVSTAYDPQGRPTVLDLLPAELRPLRIYPVGRLDIDTSGLLLLTNDGNFALRLTHPRYVTDKHYEALVQGQVKEETLEALRTGVVITEDNGHTHKTAPAQVQFLREAGRNSWIALTIHEGHKRQVRRMFSAVGHNVLQLVRVGIGPITLAGVPVSKWRYLQPTEVERLTHEST